MHEQQRSRDECGIKRRRAQHLVRLLLFFGITYVLLRSVASVIALTYAVAGEAGLLFVLSSSLIYSAVIVVVEKWIAGVEPIKHLSWIKALPRYLPLGILAVFVEVLFKHTEIETRTYPLRMLIIVFALLIPFSYKRLLSESSFPGTSGELVEAWWGEPLFNCKSVDKRCMNELADIDGRSWSLLLASQVSECVIWCYVIIEYRFYRESFLGQSVWIMASLWIFLASCGVRCLALLAGARASMRLTNSCGSEPPHKMRFRARTSPLPWLLTGFLCVYAFDAIENKSFHSSLFVNCFAALTLSILLKTFSAIFTYWEVDTSCFRQRRLWKVKEIAWRDVTRIGRVGFSNRSVMINYGRVPEECGYILVNPGNRSELIDALRKYVPHAEFDI